MKFLKNLFDEGRQELRKIEKIADQVMALETQMAQLTDEQLQTMTPKLKARYAAGETLDQLLPEAFAVVREAATRVLGMTPYYVQVIGGITLHRGDIAEMKTGEGKTLTSTMPAYLNALTGKGVHIVTVNEYLAHRDAKEMGQLHEWLGLTVGLNVNALTPEQKQAAYACDITYSTNNELGFDYLRDNMVLYKENKSQRPLHYAIIDEVDSILVDEARTPLIISGGQKNTANLYRYADMFAKMLKVEQDYEIDVEAKSIQLTENGISRAEEIFKLENLFDIKHTELVHRIQQALKANYTMHNDVDYVTANDEILIVDQFTGRIMQGRQFSEGLHQALEAKEGVSIKEETTTLATVTFQNFFRLYEKISGMTGTAKTEEEEFRNIYNMRVIAIPTNRPILRIDAADLVYANIEAKYKAIVEEVKVRHEKGQPILIGTVAIETSELLSAAFKKAGIRHEVLNAKNHEREAEIVMLAGQKGAVTIATNMAGRGTDIKLGEGVSDLGGLAIIGSERHESRRIDNQLRGRAGRQGDNGYTRFYISLEDELMIRFGGDRIKGMMQNLGLGEEPIESKMLTRQVESAQKRVEGVNYDIRKSLLQYDEVLRQQREIMYSQRDEILYADDITHLVHNMFNIAAETLVARHLNAELREHSEKSYQALVDEVNLQFTGKQAMTLATVQGKTFDEVVSLVHNSLIEVYEAKHELADPKAWKEFQKVIALRVVDQNWMAHIDAMSHLRDGIHFRAYAQQDPLRAYEEEGFQMFDSLNHRIAVEISMYIIRAEIVDNLKRQEVAKGHAVSSQADTNLKAQPKRNDEKVGRNEPCPCGSGKKSKDCCNR
ncbi:MAG: preprotein translocase subunit SecA [Culicoidibacterales bacterium]